MITKETTEMARSGCECLKKAVQEEFRKKAMLGQYVIINRDGKPWRVLAKTALKMAEHKGQQ
jgi:hypothetical protein